MTFTIGIIVGAAFGAVGTAIGTSHVLERRDERIEQLEAQVAADAETIRLLTLEPEEP